MIKQHFLGLMAFCIGLSGCNTSPANETYLIEAEQFSNQGGWVLDHQAFNKIGSAYLMAHGMGTPVEDASTSVKIKNEGDYHLYVNTYNWTHPWYEGKGPGAFCIKVNEKIVTDTLGTDGDSWGWTYAGKVHLKGDVKIALHDYTGFNGRVDALYLTPQKEAMPVNYQDMLAFHQNKLNHTSAKEVEKADLVVVGAGVAGCATALTAARLGLNVTLIDNLDKLGGNNYLGVNANGVMSKNKYPHIGDMTRELCDISNEDFHLGKEIEKIKENGNGFPIISNNREKTAALRERLLKEAGVKIYHRIHIYKADKEGDKITGLTGKDLKTNEDFVFTGKQYVDCTGDGEIGFLLGAEYMIGREPKSFANEPSAPDVKDWKMMGSTLSWKAGKANSKTVFPSIQDLPWAMQCSKEYHVKGWSHNWTWETGFEIDNAKEPELVRDNMLRAIYGNWAYVKNAYPEFKNAQLETVSYVAQKRESRRLKGDIILNENDIRNQVEYPDASFTTTWTMDLHFPQPENTKYFKGWEWKSGCPNKDKSSWIKPYHVPYRVLYSKEFSNLFIGGRCMSVTHIALGTVRVQITLGMAGEVIGMAAKICDKYNVPPRGVYEKHLDELIELMNRGVR